MVIEFIILLAALFIFGAVFGSFACCQAWRIHAKSEHKKLGSRSVCMSCNKQLKWYDNIPVLSWLLLRGKCRFCHAKIGKAEILSELSLGLTFLLIGLKLISPFCFNQNGDATSFYAFISNDFFYFFPTIIVLISAVLFWILLIYDAKWGELPVLPMLVLVALSLFYQFALMHGDPLRTLMAVGILAGIYYLLYFFSKEKWVGGGDWILCLSIAIFLGRPELAIVELFLSNFLACLASVPITLKKKDHQIPFGPFLITAFIAIFLLSDWIIKHLLVF